MKDLTFEQIEQSLLVSPALEDVADKRDYQLNDFITGAVNIPDSFDLRDKQSKIKNQGIRGTCTAHATAAISEYFNRYEYDDFNLDLSEEFLFKKTKEIDLEDYGYDGYGAYLRSSAKAYEKYGVCTEELLPYARGEKESYWRTVAITKDQEDAALQYRAKSYASVQSTVDALKEALIVTQAPLLCGFRLYESYRKAKEDGYFPVPDRKTEKLLSSHAMAIVGFDKSYFILKNSFGETWGDNGWCYWPFAGIAYMFSAWSFLDKLDEKVLQAQIMKENRKQVPIEWGPEALEAWDKAAKRGILSHKTKFHDTMTIGRWLIFKDRAGEL